MADESSRAGERYATSQIIDWLSKTHHPHDAALEAAYDAPHAHDMPPIQLGAPEGRLLELLLRLSGAQRVVEVGTLAGYSALWIVRALPEDGHLWTIESDPKHAAVARDVFDQAGVEDRITVLEGDALGLLPKLSDSGPFLRRVPRCRQSQVPPLRTLGDREPARGRSSHRRQRIPLWATPERNRCGYRDAHIPRRDGGAIPLGVCAHAGRARGGHQGGSGHLTIGVRTGI